MAATASIPANPAQGRIEDALCGVMPLGDAITLKQLLQAVPPGWSRTTVVNAITDALFAGWIEGIPGGRHRLKRVAEVPQVPPDPLAKRAAIARLRRLVEQAEADLHEAVGEAKRLFVSGEHTFLAVQEGRTVVRKALRYLPPDS